MTVSWIGVKSPRLRSLRPRAAKLARGENRRVGVGMVDFDMVMVLLQESFRHSSAGTITIWTITECNIGIIAGSMPSLKPLFKPILGGSYARSFKGRYSYATGSQGKSSSGRATYLSSKDFAVLGGEDRGKEAEEDFEAQSQVSQMQLVCDKWHSLGFIEKTVTSTVTSMERVPSRSSPHLGSYEVGHAR